jgi:hypothetical protein
MIARCCSEQLGQSRGVRIRAYDVKVDIYGATGLPGPLRMAATVYLLSGASRRYVTNREVGRDA